MAQKKQLVYLAINLGLVLLNLRLWLFVPARPSASGSHRSPGYAYENLHDYEDGEPRVDQRRQSGSNRKSRPDAGRLGGRARDFILEQSNAGDMGASDGGDGGEGGSISNGGLVGREGNTNLQRRIQEQWAQRHSNANGSAVKLPETDVYVTPTPIKAVATRTDYWRLRKEYTVPAITYTKLVHCARILQNDSAEILKAKRIMASRPYFKVPIYEETYLNWTGDCARFREDRGYIQVPPTREEEEFPLAFSIAMYTDVEQTERLLRAIYQPQNFYCIHIDTKSSVLIHRTIRAIANCFDNVWIATHLDKIKWGDISVILPEINCMRDLVRYFGAKKWKYFINLTGQEFPLRTNYELVRIAKIFNGSNDIGGSFSRIDRERVNFIWTHRWSITYQQTIFYNTYAPHPPPPFNVTFFKGELHGLFSRGMVEYLVTSRAAKDYLQWCWDTGHPSEHYWNVLNYNPHLGAPGGYIGPLDIADTYAPEPMIRVKNWVGLYGNRTCNGKIVRGICVYGIDDAPWLATRHELFANKFHLTFHHLGYDCLEELHRNRTKLKDRVPFKPWVYEKLPTVLYSRKDGLT